MGEFTELLRQLESGEAGALDRLAQLAYPELRKLARARLYASGPERLLRTTELVHECYLRLAGAQRLRIVDRKRFYAYAAKIMRSIIVDELRDAKAQKRGGGAIFTTLDSTGFGAPMVEDDVERIDRALQTLAGVDQALATVVEMRFFGGFTEAEIAEALDSSERTVRRQWDKARLLLAEMLAPDGV